MRVAGVVENYRDRIFKNGGSRVVFFELEDEVGRVDVKVSEKKIESSAALLTGGEPVLVDGKVSFPMGAEDDGDDVDASKKATLFLESVQSLADAVANETRGVSIRLPAERVKPDHLRSLRDLLERSPGTCPVSLVIELPEGALAFLSVGSSLRVAPTDAMLAGLERLFGDNVAELR